MSRKQQIENAQALQELRRRPFTVKYRVFDTSYPTGSPPRMAAAFEIADDTATCALALCDHYGSVRITNGDGSKHRDLRKATSAYHNSGLPNQHTLTMALMKWSWEDV